MWMCGCVISVPIVPIGLLGNTAVVAEDQKGRKMGAEIKDSMRVSMSAFYEQSVFVHQSVCLSCKCVCECVCKCVGVWLGEMKIEDEERGFQQE